MLTFRNTNIFFGIIIGFLLVLNLSIHIRLPVYLGAIILYIALLVYGSCRIGSNFFMKVICSSNTGQKLIALSFDDGPAEKYTSEILNVLKEQKVPAAFFCIGKRIVDNGALMREAHEQGHIIGNHSYSHTPFFDLLNSGAMMKDVQKADEAVSKSIGIRPKLFRPPYGVTTPAMKKVMVRGGYTAVGWSIRSLDTIATSEKKLLGKLTKRLHPGAVVLLHDTQRITLSVLPQFIQAARNEGYEFVRLDSLLNIKWHA